MKINIAKLRNLYPNLPAFKKMAAKARVSRIQSYLLPADVTARCEADPAQIQGAVDEYAAKYPKVVRQSEKTIDAYLDQGILSAGGDRTALRNDVLFCQMAYGFTPEEYVYLRLAEKAPETRRAFLSNLDRRVLSYRMNDIKDMVIFLDKTRTYARLAAYYGRDAIPIETQKDYATFLSFVEKHPVFVKKKVSASFGRSVELIDLAASDQDPKALFDQWIGQGKHILEEKLEQTDFFRSLNPSSVNTVRCFTFLTNHGVLIRNCFLRIGRQGSFVDNAGGGGISVSLDDETGRALTDGYDEYGRVFETHPESGVWFRDLQVPDWQEMRETCIRMAQEVPSVRYVGWDMARTERCWAVVEGNCMGQQMVQMLQDRPVKAEMLEYMEDMDLVF